MIQSHAFSIVRKQKSSSRCHMLFSLYLSKIIKRIKIIRTLPIFCKTTFISDFFLSIVGMKMNVYVQKQSLLIMMIGKFFSFCHP